MAEDETDRLITSAFGQVARSDQNASVLRGFAIAVIAIAFVSALAFLVAALWIGFDDDESLGLAALPAVLISLGVLVQGLFIWAVLAALANLVSGGARILEIQAVNLSLAMSEEEGQTLSG